MSKIAWTEKTWQPVVGCTKVSPGCQNCYAERMAFRLGCMGQKKYQSILHPKTHSKFIIRNKWTGKTFCDEAALDIPLKRKKPTTYFVCSMGDLFHESVPFEFIAEVFNVISQSKQHVFQILTKRPEIMERWFRWYQAEDERMSWWFMDAAVNGYLPNLWLGVTAENQEMADKRIPILKQIPCAVDFISHEPLLGYIDMQGKMPSWGIIGAESGPKARVCKLEWIRDLVKQYQDARVPVFVKQIHMWKAEWDNRVYETAEEARLHIGCANPKRVLIKDMNQFPAGLQIREYPER